MIVCPQCDAEAHDDDDGYGYACSMCEWREDRCECGELMDFHPERRGTTVGGLVVVGAMVCACGVVEVCKHSRPADALEWSLAKGGRSLTAGGLKIRAEKGDDADIEAVMARIVRVPELELELARLQQLQRRRLSLADARVPR